MQAEVAATAETSNRRRSIFQTEGLNQVLTGKPELVNEDAEGAGWIFKIKLAEPSELDTLLDRDAYLAYVRE
jgi:glycine cleavage system H lipoate-binding protein